MTKLVGALESVRTQRAVERDRIMLIGHSFGARILYSAVSQVLIYKTQLAHPGPKGQIYKPIAGPADLVLLINPALDSSAYTSLDAIRRNRKDVLYKERFSEKQEPILLSISTTNDEALSWPFYVGQWLGLARTDKELTALGYHDKYATHQLERRAMPARPEPTTDWTSAFCDSGICLNRVDEAQHHPYLVVRTSGDILAGHGGIWSPDFVSWTMRLMKEVDSRSGHRAAP